MRSGRERLAVLEIGYSREASGGGGRLGWLYKYGRETAFLSFVMISLVNG